MVFSHSLGQQLIFEFFNYVFDRQNTNIFRWRKLEFLYGMERTCKLNTERTQIALTGIQILNLVLV